MKVTDEKVIVPKEGNKVEVGDLSWNKGKIYYPTQLGITGSNGYASLTISVLPEYRNREDSASTNYMSIQLKGEEVVEAALAMLEKGSVFVGDAELVAMLTKFRETCVKHLEEVKAREERRKKEGN